MSKASGNEEPSSLEYIEDPYINPASILTETPSLDDDLDDNFEYLDPDELELFNLRQLDFDDLNRNSIGGGDDDPDSNINVEAEFVNVKRANAIIRAFFKDRNFKRQVRVTYCDLTKPYLAKFPKDGSFRKYLDISLDDEEALAAGDSNRSLEHNAMSEEEREKQMEEWRAELARIEEEIQTLSGVLASKVRRSAELKRHLGITVWKEVTDDINQGIKNVKTSNVYQKTTSIIGGITGGITNKLGQMRHSESFKSFEERASSAMESVKRRLSNASPTQ